MGTEEEKCQACGDEVCSPPHTCPFRYEVDWDGETMCNCCESCTSQCQDDI